MAALIHRRENESWNARTGENENAVRRSRSSSSAHRTVGRHGPRRRLGQRLGAGALAAEGLRRGGDRRRDQGSERWHSERDDQRRIGLAVANGYAAGDVQVNIPPTSGNFAPGPGKGPLLSNDCSTPAVYPCWVEVVITKPHDNFFAGVIGQGTWDVSAKGVAVGGIANSVSNGLSPIMFNEDAVANQNPKQFCDPQDNKCTPNSDFPKHDLQFNWTTVCITGGNCNVNTNDVVDIIQGGMFTTSAWLGMDLGAHNQGQHTAACHAMLDEFPDGGTFPVVINDDNGNLRGFWMWTFDPATTDCEGTDGMLLGGHFTADSWGQYPLSETPLTISANAPAATFGLYVVKLVE